MHAERVVVMMKSVGTLEKEENMGRLTHSLIYLSQKEGRDRRLRGRAYLTCLPSCPTV